VINLKDIPILFENDFCMVLNKPSGLPAQGGEGVKVSLDSLLSKKISPRPLLVHRLDRDTSGAILIAKTPEAAREFSVLFAGGRIKKIYLGVCAGMPAPESGIIGHKLDVRGKEKKSETFYRVLSSRAEGEIIRSLLELRPGTGRMHQIRRHLAQIGHPLLGDDKYGNFPLNKQIRKMFGLKCLLLHASRLIIPPLFCLPGGLDIEAPLPEYFSTG
jgi:23S rRNA pseudouridine955/2504/2580 synthase